MSGSEEHAARQSAARDVAEDFRRHRIGRREFLGRAGALGLSAGAAFALLESLGADRASATPSATSRTLRMGPTMDPGPFDPVKNFFGTSAGLDGLYEPLVAYKKQPWPTWRSLDEKVNVLAERFEVSKDGKTILFELKKGIPFHKNFGEVTAEDVKFSFERLAGIQKTYPDAAKKDGSGYESEWAALQRVRVTGRYRGLIVLKQPSNYVLETTIPWSSSGMIVSKKAVQKYGKNGYPTRPIGTGPYEMARYVPKREWTLERFERYGGADRYRFDWDAIHTPIQAAPASGGETIPFEAGEVDLLNIPKQSDAGRLRRENSAKVYPVQNPGYQFVAMNVQSPKLRDIRVRQAIRYAIDVPALLRVQEFPQKFRINSICDAPPYGANGWKNAPQYERDVAKAKALLAAAGVSNLELDLYGGYLGQTVEQVIQANLKDVGITVNIKPLLATGNYPGVGEAEVIATGYSSIPDPFYAMEWFTCGNVWNLSYGCNKTFDSLLKSIDLTTNRRKRAADSIRMQQLMDQSAAFVWIASPVVWRVSTKRVNAVIDPAAALYPAHTRFIG